MLEEISDSIWLAEGGVVIFFGLPYPTRSVVVRLNSGDLWIWSPIKLTSRLKEEVNALGRVAHLVSPNKIHHLYLQEWKYAYPGAKLWGPGSTIRKRKDLIFHAELKDLPPCEWKDEIDQAWFKGSFAMDEVIFFHRPSKTTIIADLSENFSPEFLSKHWNWWRRILAKPWGITVEHGLPPLEWRLTWLHRAPARKARDKALSWKCDRVIMAHGEWRRKNGHAYLEKAFSWLGN